MERELRRDVMRVASSGEKYLEILGDKPGDGRVCGGKGPHQGIMP